MDLGHHCFDASYQLSVWADTVIFANSFRHENCCLLKGNLKVRIEFFFHTLGQHINFKLRRVAFKLLYMRARAHTRLLAYVIYDNLLFRFLDLYHKFMCKRRLYVKLVQRATIKDLSHYIHENLQMRNFLKINFLRKSYRSDFVDDPNRSFWFTNSN